MSLPTTPSQTVGPFFHIGLAWSTGPLAVPEGFPGAIWIRGTVLDGAGDPVPDALVETWQADARGRFAHPADPRGPAEPGDFCGFCRCPTDERGSFAIRTIKPGRVPFDLQEHPERLQAPHIAVTVLARGLLDRVVTRIYFADERAANDEDPVLALVDASRRQTLLAFAEGGDYRFDIHLQGPRETVFFAV